MTNLRLPGQYDERLLGSLGLQGPYYNWNRWYLPSVGRYLELDPIALEGGFNNGPTVDWYNYAAGNPLAFADPTGLLVEAYCEPIRFPYTAFRHCYIRSVCETCPTFDMTYEIWGPSPELGFPNGQPVEGFNNPGRNGSFGTVRVPVSPSHSSDCSLEKCIREQFLRLKDSLPPYNPLGPNSNTFANSILAACGASASFPWNAPGAP